MSRGRANLASSLERIDQRRQRVEQRVFEARTCISEFVAVGGARIAGFDTDAELLSRLLFGRPHLHALLGILGDEGHRLPAPKDEPRRSPKRSREPSKEHPKPQLGKELVPTDVRGSPSDRIAALSRVVSLVSRLEDGIARDVRTLQEQLAAIDRDGQWRECAYLSYEEFLERALGPDPRLSLLLSVDPPPKPDALARVERAPLARANRHQLARSDRRLPSLADPPSTPPPRNSLSESVEPEPVFAMAPPGPSPSMPPVGAQMSPAFLSTRPGAFTDPTVRTSFSPSEAETPVLTIPPEAMIEENPDDEPPAWLSFAEPPPEETALVVAEAPRVSREVVVARRAVPPILAIQLFIAALAILVGAAIGWSTLHQQPTDESSNEGH